MKIPRKSFVYLTTNLVNGKIYIGQHNGSKSWYYGSGKAFYNAFRKYGKENFRREILVDNIENQALLDDLEIHYIRLYNSTNKDIGYNIHPGGRGGTISNDTKEKIRKALTGRKRPQGVVEKLKNRDLSYLRTKEVREKVANKLRGVPRSEEVKRKSSEKMKGRKPTEYCLKRKVEVQEKKVNQYDLNGNFIKTWQSATIAAKEIKVSQGKISSCCRQNNINFTAFGYQWRFYEGNINNIEKFIPHKKINEVLQYDLEGNFIREWLNANDAYKELGINGSNILKVCRGERESTCGFIWKYKN